MEHLARPRATMIVDSFFDSRLTTDDSRLTTHDSRLIAAIAIFDIVPEYDADMVDHSDLRNGLSDHLLLI